MDTGLIMKKWMVALFVWVVMIGGGIVLNIFLPHTFQSIEKRVRDFFFILRGPLPTTGKVVIVDIDEKSLAAIGQWPWERDVVAKLLRKLTDMGAGIIGLDIVFAERDKTSPAYLNEKLKLNLNSPEDYDSILSRTIASTPTIIGYIFDMNEIHEGKYPPDIPAVIVEKGESVASVLPEAKGVIANIDTINDNAYSGGFINTIPDESGMIRGVPMLMSYDETLYPSLTLEMVRIAYGVERIEVIYGESIGVESLKIGELEIPTDRHGRMMVNFRGPSHTFKYISAVDILDGNISQKEIAGKFVLLGTSAAGLFDMRATPFDSVMPGVEIHASIIDNMLRGDFLSRPGWTDGADLVIFVVISTFVFLLFLGTGALWQPFLLPILAFGIYYLLRWILFTQGILLNTLYPFVALISAAISAMLINYFFETKQKLIIREKFAKKVSPAVVEDILESEEENLLSGREENVSVFFSDIRSFTTISEKLGSPQRVIELLNFYMTPMTDIILESGGTVDKFIGDAIMAYWNAPKRVKEHPDVALVSALKQLEVLKELNSEIEKRFGFPIAIGIGINSGTVTVGEMGSRGRSDYTIIGDTVNLASRLEGLNKLYGTHLIVSENTKRELKRDYVLRELDQVKVKGKKEAVRIYEVISQGKAAGELEKELLLHHEALQSYYEGSFAKALEAFETLHADNERKLYELYIQRCRYYLSHPEEGERFDGVFTATTK